MVYFTTESAEAPRRDVSLNRKESTASGENIPGLASELTIALFNTESFDPVMQTV